MLQDGKPDPARVQLCIVEIQRLQQEGKNPTPETKIEGFTFDEQWSAYFQLSDKTTDVCIMAPEGVELNVRLEELGSVKDLSILQDLGYLPASPEETMVTEVSIFKTELAEISREQFFQQAGNEDELASRTFFKLKESYEVDTITYGGGYQVVAMGWDRDDGGINIYGVARYDFWGPTTAFLVLREENSDSWETIVPKDWMSEWVRENMNDPASQNLISNQVD